jgi:hypothetical protein
MDTKSATVKPGNTWSHQPNLFGTIVPTIAKRRTIVGRVLLRETCNPGAAIAGVSVAFVRPAIVSHDRPESSILVSPAMAVVNVPKITKSFSTSIMKAAEIVT